MLAQCKRVERFVPISSRKLGLFFVPLLLMVGLLYACFHVDFGLAVEKQDTAKGTIQLVLEEKKPENSNNYYSQQTSNTTINNYSSIKDFLANTGDNLPYVVIAIFVVGLAGLSITVIMRKRELKAGYISNSTFAKSSTLRNIVICGLGLILIVGSLFALSWAFADENGNSNIPIENDGIAGIFGRITVSEEGIIKNSEIHVNNNLRTDLRLKKLIINDDSEIAGFINEKISTDDNIIGGGVLNKDLGLKGKRITNQLLTKLKENNSKSISYEVKSDVSYDTVKVEFLSNDGTEKVFDTQELPKSGNAILPVAKPTFNARKFICWNTDKSGEGDNVDSWYLNAHNSDSDIKFYAKWENPDVFLAEASMDKELPYKIYTGKNKTSAIKSIEEVKAAADSLKKGEEVDKDIFSPTNDKWHLFAKIYGDGSSINDWLECRIIHAGQHDNDGSGLTFQAVHALPSQYQFSEDGYNNWEKSDLRRFMNSTLLSNFPNVLNEKIMSIEKSSSAENLKLPYVERAKKRLIDIKTNDKLWIISLTESLKYDKAERETKIRMKDEHEGSLYKFWDHRNTTSLGVGRNDEITQRDLHRLCCNRFDLVMPFSYGNEVLSWQRSARKNPHDDYKYHVLTIRNRTGFDTGALNINSKYECCVNPCFAL